jgi:hypothetical protein
MKSILVKGISSESIPPGLGDEMIEKITKVLQGAPDAK